MLEVGIGSLPLALALAAGLLAAGKPIHVSGKEVGGLQLRLGGVSSTGGGRQHSLQQRVRARPTPLLPCHKVAEANWQLASWCTREGGPGRPHPLPPRPRPLPPPPHTHTHTITRAPSLPPDPHPLPQAEVDASLRRQGRGLLLELHQLNGVMRLLQD